MEKQIVLLINLIALFNACFILIVLETEQTVVPILVFLATAAFSLLEGYARFGLFSLLNVIYLVTLLALTRDV